MADVRPPSQLVKRIFAAMCVPTASRRLLSRAWYAIDQLLARHPAVAMNLVRRIERASQAEGLHPDIAHLMIVEVAESLYRSAQKSDIETLRLEAAIAEVEVRHGLRSGSVLREGERPAEWHDLNAALVERETQLLCSYFRSFRRDDIAALIEADPERRVYEERALRGKELLMAAPDGNNQALMSVVEINKSDRRRLEQTLPPTSNDDNQAADETSDEET